MVKILYDQMHRDIPLDWNVGSYYWPILPPFLQGFKKIMAVLQEIPAAKY
jgi:hypothetical protein